MLIPKQGVCYHTARRPGSYTVTVPETVVREGEIDIFLLIERQEPVPHVAHGDPGCLGELRVVDVIGCLALGVLDRLQDHLLSAVQFGHDLASLVHNSWKMTKAESVRASHRHISMASMVLNR